MTSGAMLAQSSSLLHIGPAREIRSNFDLAQQSQSSHTRTEKSRNRPVLQRRPIG
jgi:hypothetical protein